MLMKGNFGDDYDEHGTEGPMIGMMIIMMMERNRRTIAKNNEP